MWEEQLAILLETNDLSLFEDWLVTYEAETGDISLRDLLVEDILNMIFSSINRILSPRSDSLSVSWSGSRSRYGSWSMFRSRYGFGHASKSRSLARSKSRLGSWSGSRTRTRAWPRSWSGYRH